MFFIDSRKVFDAVYASQLPVNLFAKRHSICPNPLQRIVRTLPTCEVKITTLQKVAKALSTDPYSLLANESDKQTAVDDTSEPQTNRDQRKD